jgi:uncharacterized membrane protein YfcA
MWTSLELWYLLPVSILIATIAMTTGIGGAVFFSPLFIVVLKLEPSVAVGTALMTELFGFGSGVSAYWRRGLIDFRLGYSLLMFSAPAAILGSLGADLLPADVLKGIFAAGIIFIGSQIYISYRPEEAEESDEQIAEESRDECESTLTDASGTEYHYSADSSILSQVFGVVKYTIPGVLIGGQLGPLLQARLNPDVAKVGISVLFIAVGVFMFVTLI